MGKLIVVLETSLLMIFEGWIPCGKLEEYMTVDGYWALCYTENGMLLALV